MAEDTEMSYMAKFSLDNSNFMSGLSGMAIGFDAIVMASQTGFAAIQQGYEMTIGFAVRYMDALDDLADQTGTTLENVQRLRAAAIGVGTDAEDAANSFRIFNQRLGDAGAAGEVMRSQLASMGVQVKDVNGNFRDSYEIFMDTNGALHDMTNGTERAAIMNDLFGRSGYKIIDMIEDYDEAKEKATAKPMFSEADQKAVEEYDRDMKQLTEDIGRFETKVGVALLAVGKWGNALNDLSKGDINPLVMLMNDKSSDGSKTASENMDKQSVSTAALTDKYMGMTTVELDLALAKENVAKAENEYNLALKKTQPELDAAAIKLQVAKNKVDDLREAMALATATATTMGRTMAKAMAPGWSGESIVGEAGSEMQLFLQKEMDAGTDYQTALQNWMNGSPTAAPGANTVAGQGMSPAKKQSIETINAAKETSEGLLNEYVKQEDYSRTHWMALSEYERIAVSDMAANLKTYVNFAAAYPTIHNIGIVVWDKKGPDWSPESNPIFMQSARRASLASQELSFAKSDFSQVEGNASKQQAVNLTIINEKNVSSKVIQENSQATAANLSVNGAS